MNEEKKISLLYYIEIFIKWKKFILIEFIVVLVLSIILSLVLPKWYKASASIMPPANPGLLGSFGGAGSLLKNLGVGAKLGGMDDMGAYNYLAILKSRTAYEEIVNKFNLIEEYDVSENSMEKAIKELDDNVKFNLEDDDYISIDVWDIRQEKVADIANHFIEILNRMSIQFATSEAKNNREFIEKRYFQALTDLKNAEDSLKLFFKNSKMMIIPDEKTSGFGGVADIYAEKVKSEIQLELLGKTVGKSNPLYQKADFELKAIENKLANVPDIGIESLRKYREVLIQQKILEFMMPLYEQAKIEEKKDMPVIVVLDKAKTPEKKDKPKRVVLVLLITLGSLLVTILSIYTYESIVRSENYTAIKSAFSKNRINKN